MSENSRTQNPDQPAGNPESPNAQNHDDAAQAVAEATAVAPSAGSDSPAEDGCAPAERAPAASEPSETAPPLDQDDPPVKAAGGVNSVAAGGELDAEGEPSALEPQETESDPAPAARFRRQRPLATPAPESNVGRIKLDPGFDPVADPLRPAGRLPALPSDEELAAAQGAAKMRVEAGHRPTEEEAAKRKAALDRAANTKPVLTRVCQVLLAIFYPIVLLVLAIRLVTSNVFLWVEYHRPGFPADSYGFTTDDRITYGSYTVDYLLNFSGPRYLGDLVDKIGNPLFLAREVDHMADVKTVMGMALVAGLVLAIGMILCMVYLAKRSDGGIRRGLFAGSIATLALIVALGVFAATGWDRFFTEFHKIFFADGTWTFYLDDTLIRLFPAQFWMDAGIFIGAFVLVVSSLTLAFTWPTRDRRRVRAAE